MRAYAHQTCTGMLVHNILESENNPNAPQGKNRYAVTYSHSAILHNKKNELQLLLQL